MSRAAKQFAQSILDAEHLLSHFDALNSNPPPPHTEVLKRAGLVMAMTAWETYVEDRLEEFWTARLSRLEDKGIAPYVQARFADEIKRLHNPSADKTAQLFRDFCSFEVTESWTWSHFDPGRARDSLN